MNAYTLSTNGSVRQREMAQAIGQCAQQIVALRSAKIGTPEAARRAQYERYAFRIVALHRCNCPGIDERLRASWAAVARKDYETALRIAQEWRA